MSIHNNKETSEDEYKAKIESLIREAATGCIGISYEEYELREKF